MCERGRLKLIYMVLLFEIDLVGNLALFLSSTQREVRQREAARGLAWPSQPERTLFYFCWRGRIWVRHCCFVLARSRQRKLKCSFLALLNNEFEALNLLIISLY
jgi:hypothetical protein